MARFGHELQHWRRQSRLSQAEVADRANVSQRHVSFLESGRSKPSRTMTIKLASALDLPLRARNKLLVAGGFAPAYGERDLGDPALASLRAATRYLLERHEPFPGIAIGRGWIVADANRAMARLASFLLTGRENGEVRTVGVDLLQTLTDPRGMNRCMLEREYVASIVLRRALREAEHMGDENEQARIARLLSKVKVGVADAHEESQLRDPMLTTTYERDGIALRFTTFLVAFGTPFDATAQEFRLELFHPADKATAMALRKWAQR